MRRQGGHNIRSGDKELSRDQETRRLQHKTRRSKVQRQDRTRPDDEPQPTCSLLSAGCSSASADGTFYQNAGEIRKVISRPGRSQELLYKHIRNSLIKFAMICENIFTAPPHPNGIAYAAFSNKIDHVTLF